MNNAFADMFTACFSILRGTFLSFFLCWQLESLQLQSVYSKKITVIAKRGLKLIKKCKVSIKPLFDTCNLLKNIVAKETMYTSYIINHYVHMRLFYKALSSTWNEYRDTLMPRTLYVKQLDNKFYGLILV